MPRDTCDPTCMCLNTCKIPSRIKKPPVQISVPTMQLHMPNMNFVVIAATLVTVTLCFHSSTVSCFALSETFTLLQQQETLYFGYSNLGLDLQFQISKSSCLCRQGCMCNLMLMHQFLDQLTLTHQFHTPTEAHRLGYQLSQLGHSK